MYMIYNVWEKSLASLISMQEHFVLYHMNRKPDNMPCWEPFLQAVVSPVPCLQVRLMRLLPLVESHTHQSLPEGRLEGSGGPNWPRYLLVHCSVSFLNRHCCNGNKSKWLICMKCLCLVEDYSTNNSKKVLSKYPQYTKTAIKTNFHFSQYCCRS